MVNALRNALTRFVTVADEATDTHVHFHQGPAGAPAPCFDAGCDVPALNG